MERKNAQSYLTNEHIKEIADAYLGYKDIECFSRIVSISEIGSNDYSLSIPLYIKEATEGTETFNDKRVIDCVNEWQSASLKVNESYGSLISLMKGEC